MAACRHVTPAWKAGYPLQQNNVVPACLGAHIVQDHKPAVPPQSLHLNHYDNEFFLETHWIAPTSCSRYCVMLNTPYLK